MFKNSNIQRYQWIKKTMFCSPPSKIIFFQESINREGGGMLSWLSKKWITVKHFLGNFWYKGPIQDRVSQRFYQMLLFAPHRVITAFLGKWYDNQNLVTRGNLVDIFRFKYGGSIFFHIVVLRIYKNTVSVVVMNIYKNWENIKNKIFHWIWQCNGIMLR